MINNLASILLYVPFNKDYAVDDKVRNGLSEQEFFDHCYVSMDIDKEITNAENMKMEEYEEGEDGVSGEELKREKIEKLKELKRSINNFDYWIKNNGNAVYCIKGNAGCGKSTYLHHLKYFYRNDSIKWEIIDIQKSREVVDILNTKLQIPQFNLLDYKVISAMLDNILQYIFVKVNARVSFDMTKEQLYNLFQRYKSNGQEDFPNAITRVFFEDSPLFNAGINDIKKSEVEEYAKNIYEYLKKLLSDESPIMILDQLWSIYMHILSSIDDEEKHIIAFDNFERFIGADEICNKQLWNFIETLRHLLQTCEEADEYFYHHFQMVLFMRNTTSRMGNIPLQLVDFEGHELDLSDWFPINRIIDKKLKWYSKNNIEVPNKELVDMILGDGSFDGKGMGSLQAKLSMLFNNNKRILITLLTNIVDNDTEKYLEKFIAFAKNKKRGRMRLNKFAGRSIIIRLILDELQKDNFFKNIFVEETEERHLRLGIARKILIILYNYSLYHHQEYMLLDDLIVEWRNEGRQSVNRYFDENYQNERNIISKILYQMNYYNSRTNDKLHFIDIQYNTADESIVFFVEDDVALAEMIREHHSEIGIRIMPAGEAYLHYFVQSFEYFACRIEKKKKAVPPLLTLVPNEDDLDNCKDVLELEFLDVIDSVYENAAECIGRMREISDNNRIIYQRTLNSPRRIHSDRIIDSHRGYIDNFQQCIRKKYENISITYEREKLLLQIYEELDRRRRKYERLRMG